MRRLSVTIVICVAVAALALTAGLAPARLGSRTSAAAGGTETPTTAVEAVNGLTVAMLNRLDSGQNAIVSPFSVASALAMVDQGASGQTAAQIDRLLGDADSPAALAASFGALRDALADAVGVRGGPTLQSANALWLQSGETPLAAFTRTLADRFGAAPRQVPFHSDPAGAIQTINGWVSQHTHGLIDALLSPADVSPQTNLVLANAIYLKAAWQTPFDPNDTDPADFDAPSGRVSVPFMSNQQLDVPYGAGAGYQAVALPYAHSSLQFLAVMPAAGAITTFTRSLTPTRLSVISAGLHSRRLALSMPKFTLTFEANLDGFLQGLGVDDAFGPGAQLNRMVAGRRLAIQAVVHQATLEVAEKGTVAAAATGVSLAPTAVAATPFSLTLNHPFLIFIRDARTGAVLFAARVIDPMS